MYLVNKAVINNILYDEFEERINGDLFKKVFVIDIRNFNESELITNLENVTFSKKILFTLLGMILSTHLLFFLFHLIFLTIHNNY